MRQSPGRSSPGRSSPSGGQEYNPDFIVIDTDDAHWVVEAKMDKEVDSTAVRGKREAARRWANHVTADVAVMVPWRYLLASESDVEEAKGSWPALKSLGERRRRGPPS